MHKRHFTILEILAALAIVMILMGLVMGGAGVASRMAKASRCRSQIAALETVLEQYRVNWGFYPEADSLTAAMALTSAWFNSLNTTGNKPLIDNTQIGFITDTTYGYLDPYGQPFYYQIPGIMNSGKFDLWSKGRDLKHGDNGTSPANAQSVSAKNSDDVTNWSRD